MRERSKKTETEREGERGEREKVRSRDKGWKDGGVRDMKDTTKDLRERQRERGNEAT